MPECDDTQDRDAGCWEYRIGNMGLWGCQCLLLMHPVGLLHAFLSIKLVTLQTSLGLRIHLLMQGTWVPTLLGKLRSHIPPGSWAHTPPTHCTEMPAEPHAPPSILLGPEWALVGQPSQLQVTAATLKHPRELPPLWPRKTWRSH